MKLAIQITLVFVKRAKGSKKQVNIRKTKRRTILISEHAQKEVE